MKLVIASNNQSKLREINDLLMPLAIEVIPQSVFDVVEVDEPFQTFVENALAKARNASHCSGLPAIADDSGICVSALGGAPGISSARYAGEPRSDMRNNLKLIEALKNRSDRRAYYYCMLVLVRHVEDPQPIIIDGLWHGEITTHPQGVGGFGYDPYFFVPELGKTAAELSVEQKNLISHRGKALAQFIGLLQSNKF